VIVGRIATQNMQCASKALHDNGPTPRYVVSKSFSIALTRRAIEKTARFKRHNRSLLKEPSLRAQPEIKLSDFSGL
jgi:hypothetical protein